MKIETFHNVLLAIAGALGVFLRYHIGKWINFTSLPIATVFVNTIGCFLLGYLFVRYAHSNPTVYVILGIGFCGGFTTFSTFTLDIYTLFTNHLYTQLIVYISLSIILGILGLLLGIYMAKS